MDNKYDLQKRLVEYSASVIMKISDLRTSFASEHLTKQLIRSVTSAALNYGEAQGAESKRDFIHKMGVCLKELRESQVNLQIMEAANLMTNKVKFEAIHQETKELVAIFTTIIKNTRQNIK